MHATVSGRSDRSWGLTGDAPTRILVSRLHLGAAQQQHYYSSTTSIIVLLITVLLISDAGKPFISSCRKAIVPSGGEDEARHNIIYEKRREASDRH